MKKFIYAFVALAMIACVSPALAKTPDALSFRRTLFAPAGQRMLLLEAPLGMCFMDPSYYEEGEIAEDAKDILEENGQGRLLGIFAPCMDIAAFDAGADDSALRVSGIVTWLNIDGEESTRLSRADYLGLQQEKFRETLDRRLVRGDDAPGGNDDAPSDDSSTLSPAYAALMLPWPGDYTLDKKAKATQDAVMLGYTADISRDRVKYALSGVAATTVIKDTPIALYLSYTGAKPYDPAKVRALAEKFMAQQVVLNK